MTPYHGLPPFVADSDTSEDAALSVNASASSMRTRCLELIEQSGTSGMTCDELEVAMRMRHQTCSARLRELVLTEQIYDTGVRRTTRSGRSARVYRVGCSAPIVRVRCDKEQLEMFS